MAGWVAGLWVLENLTKRPTQFNCDCLLELSLAKMVFRDIPLGTFLSANSAPTSVQPI